ncbi:MAG: tRNA-uridine aminocarboxypropyltransferase [Bdellovibrionota bacterium]
MGNRRKKPGTRCLACHMRKELCICPEIRACKETFKNKCKILILMHHRERHLTTNTGRIAALSIPNCEVHFRGLPYKTLNCAELLDAEREPLLLFPSEDAQVLTKELLEKIKKPVTLVVPDGSWRQAYKVSKREPALANAIRVILPEGKESEYQLRREPKAGGLATFEAIARAMGVIENIEMQEKLEKLFRLMVSRTMRSRSGRVDLPESEK